MTALHLAGTYTRDVGASVALIREDVLDWEHLLVDEGGRVVAVRA